MSKETTEKITTVENMTKEKMAETIKTAKRKAESSEKKDTQESNDIYEVYRENVERYFSEVKKTTADYLQSMTDFQQEIIESWRNAIDSAIALQGKFTEKLGLNTSLSEETVKVAANLSKEVNRAQQLQSEMLLASLRLWGKTLKPSTRM